MSTDHMADFATAFQSVWIVVAALIVLWVTAWQIVTWHNRRRIKAERRAASKRTLAHIRTVQTEERLARALDARAKRQASPASQRTPAPWFDGDAA